MLRNLLGDLSSRKNEIDAWFEKEWRGLTPPLYLSCDIRHASYKIGIVDTNLFPAGFNNLCPSFSRETSKVFSETLTALYPQAKKILLLAEEHTRNKFYLLNLFHLKALLEAAHFEISIGMITQLFDGDHLDVDLEGKAIRIEKISRDENTLKTAAFTPDLVLSNNDFSAGIPSILANISQPIVPNPTLGWHQRTKSAHFEHLSQMFQKFGKAFGLDPWFFSACTEKAQVNFEDDASMQELARRIDSVLDTIRSKYEEHGITETPFVYLKNNRGTYGLGLMPLFSGEEVLMLNRKKRNKLLSTKGALPADEFLIQEGIPTADFYSSYPIEPVIYAVGKKEVGGFFRIHEAKNSWESLNAPGMTFSCLCLHKLDEPHESMFLDCAQKKEVVELSCFLTRMATLATAHEML